MSWDVYVNNGQVSNGVILENDGRMYISSGGTASDTTINDGRMEIWSGGTASVTTIGDGGWMRVEKGGITDHTIISGGTMYVSSGGTATDILWTPCEGALLIESGALASFVGEYSGVYYKKDGILYRAETVNSPEFDIDKICVMSGGVTNDITFFSEEDDCAEMLEMFIYDGGTANRTNFNGGNLVVFGGTVDSTTIVQGSIEIGNGGTANNTVVEAYYRYTDAVDEGRIAYYGKMYVSSGGTATGVTLNESILSIESGGVVCGIVASVKDVYPGASTFRNNVWTINPGIHVSAGGKITGRMTFQDKTKVYAANGAILDFDLTQASPETAALLNDLNRVDGNPIYTLTVDGTQASGMYRLADGVPAFNSMLSVMNTSGEQIGSLMVGSRLETEYANYTLKVASGSLSVLVEAPGTVPPAADTVAPSAPTGLMPLVDDRNVALLWNESTDDLSGVKEYVVTYSLDGQEFTARTAIPHYVLNNADFGTWSWSVHAVDFAGNESAMTAGDAFTVSEFRTHIVEYSADNFEHVLRLKVSSDALDSFRLPTGTYQSRTRSANSANWTTVEQPIVALVDGSPTLVKSDEDGNADIFFANASGTWGTGYVAMHVGSIGDLCGTGEVAFLSGKNRLADIIEGSTDANVLLMTDDAHGDALFVDDIYSDSPDELGLGQSRIARIDEIRAGAGNDIVDMTSQRFEYTGDGLTIRGGDGDDVIWANKGDNLLFGDAGDDRIVGASGNDVIAGGIGNDRLNGGGGNDVFAFCDNWGADTVKQLETGTVTLWFVSGDKSNWDASTLTYTDGDNSVKVSGVTAEQVTLKFGDDGSDRYLVLSGMGAFDAFTSQQIFEESGKGILASL